MPRGFSDGFIRPIPDKKSGGVIKSIQRGRVYVPMSTVSTNIDISPVIRNNSIIRVRLEVPDSGDTSTSNLFVGDINTNGESIQLIRNNGGGVGCTVLWEVIEFTNVKNIQRGMYTNSVNAVPRLIPISPVDTSKSAVFFDARQRDNTSSSLGANNFPSAYLNPSDIEMRNFNTGISSLTIAWQVVEFN